jgi:transcriptional regulator with XRE-family HTH domain
VSGLWTELGGTMRELRRSSGTSLRQMEEAASWRRGTLSLVENGKARPSRALVEFYDDNFGADGLLISLLTHAYAVQPRSTHDETASLEKVIPGDALTLCDTIPPTGSLVTAGTILTAGWDIRNAGEVLWQRRTLRRVGPAAGTRYITGPRTIDLPDVSPGKSVQVRCELRAPLTNGTTIAYWRLTHHDGAEALSLTHALPVLLIARRPPL